MVSFLSVVDEELGEGVASPASTLTPSGHRRGQKRKNTRDDDNTDEEEEPVEADDDDGREKDPDDEESGGVDDEEEGEENDGADEDADEDGEGVDADEEQAAINAEKQALKDFCDAEIEKRALRFRSGAALRVIKQTKAARMDELLGVMRSSHATCLRVRDDADRGSAGKYAYLRRAYNTRQLCPSLIRCSLHEEYDQIFVKKTEREPTDAGDAPDDGERGAAADERPRESGVGTGGGVAVDAVDDEVAEITDRILEIIRNRRVTVRSVLIFSDKKPRVVKADDVTVVDDRDVVDIIDRFHDASAAFDSAVAEHKVLRKKINEKALRALPVVASYLDRTCQQSQSIVMSQNNNQKVVVRRRDVNRRPPIKVALFKETVHVILRRFKDTLGGAKIEWEDLQRAKDALIEDIILLLKEQQPVEKVNTIRLVLARGKKAKESGR